MCFVYFLKGDLDTLLSLCPSLKVLIIPFVHSSASFGVFKTCEELEVLDISYSSFVASPKIMYNNKILRFSYKERKS